MSIDVDAGLLAAAVKALGITVPIYSARKLKGGAVEVVTRDGAQVYRLPKVKTAPESVSKPRVPRKRATPGEMVGGKK